MNKSEQTETLKDLENSASRNDNKLIEGIWAENEEENALFMIDEDTFYYFEHMDEPLEYRLNGDKLLVKNDSEIEWNIIKLTKDSLWMTNQYLDDTLKLYNRK
jgi:hypothetical protein